MRLDVTRPLLVAAFVSTADQQLSCGVLEARMYASSFLTGSRSFRAQKSRGIFTQWGLMTQRVG
jgi:hypothetical protein